MSLEIDLLILESDLRPLKSNLRPLEMDLLLLDSDLDLRPLDNDLLPLDNDLPLEIERLPLETDRRPLETDRRPLEMDLTLARGLLGLLPLEVDCTDWLRDLLFLAGEALCDILPLGTFGLLLLGPVIFGSKVVGVFSKGARRPSRADFHR